MESVRLEKNKDGIIFAFIDNKGGRVNTLSERVIMDLESVLDETSADPFAKALVFISGKKDSFIAGADISDFDKIRDRGHAKEIISRVHALFGRISDLHCPAIAAIDGACLGGGMELALACHFRIATDSDKTILGLPEVKLGILPAAGATVRLTRKVGVRKALALMLSGKNLSARRAKDLGIVDILVYPDGLAETVKRCVPFLRKKFPGIASYPAMFSLDWLLRTVTPVRRMYFQAARTRVSKLSSDHYPAPFRLIDCVEAGVAGSMSDGFKAELEAFGPLVVSSQSQALRHLFFARTELKKKSYGTEPGKVDLLGIVGGGFMGTGIAAVSARSGYRVAVKDVSEENLSKGLKEIWESLDRQVRSSELEPVQRDKLYSQVVPIVDYKHLARAELVIEAVFEDLATKQRVLRETESFTSAGSIFASNTSAIPISRIAQASVRPENVIGMHYFSPVQKMPLLEVICTQQCADWVLATAVSVGRRQGKTVIVVRDGPGFYVTRTLMPFMLEAVRLIGEGAAIDDVDAALRGFGFPVGPLRLLDEVGIDIAAHVALELEEFFADRELIAPGALELMLKAGYLGKKKGGGFYDYQPRLIDRLRVNGWEPSRPVNPKVYDFFGSRGRQSVDFPLIQKRLVFLMLNEAALCLEQGTISCPEDGDIGAVLGLGFPPFLGGPFRYIDSEGIGRIVSEMQNLSSTLGSRFEPAPILIHMAGREEKFYAR